MKRQSVLNKKGEIVKPFILFREGDIIDYQTVIEEKVGMWLSKIKIYDENMDKKVR